MKLAFLAAAIFGSAVASAQELRGAPAQAAVEPVIKYVYAPPAVETDLKTLWDELANEAAFMQEEIALGRSTVRCKQDCNDKAQNNRNFNKARCRQNCDQIRDAGNNNRDTRMPCSDCNTFPRGGNRWERCKSSCIEGEVNRFEDCNDAETCGECRRWCSGNRLDNCLDDLRCGGSNSDRDNRRCRDARTCGECNDWCSGDDRDDCRDDYCGNGDSRNCRSPRRCSDCNGCRGTDRTRCRDRCGAAEEANGFLEGAFQQ